MKTAVIGLSDGSIIAFAAATACSVIYPGSWEVLKYVGSVSIAGALIMGVGGYLSAKFRMETLTAKTVEEEDRQKKEDTKKTIALFKKLGIGEDMQQQASDEIEKDSTEWKDFLKKNQQPFEIPDKRTLPSTGFTIGITFLAGAFLALAAYLVFNDSQKAFWLSLWINIPALFIFGYTRSYANGEPLLWGSFRLALLGTAAAAAAFLVAGVFAR